MATGPTKIPIPALISGRVGQAIDALISYMRGGSDVRRQLEFTTEALNLLQAQINTINKALYSANTAVITMPVYANNTAALAAGLEAGALFTDGAGGVFVVF